MPEPELIQRQREAVRSFRRTDPTRAKTKPGIAPIVPRGCAQRVSASLPAAVKRIVQTLQPQAIILFGSYAYGTPTPDSDVDLLVIWETQLPRLERYLAVSQLLAPRPFPVDILVKTPDELAHALAAGDFFLRDIVDRGEMLYER